MKKQEKSAVKLQPGCDNCGKAVATANERSITTWLFRKETCSCSPDEGSGASPACVPQDESSFERASDSLALPRMGERYEVIDFIGRGGMGEVFRVREKLTGQILAAKVLSQKTGKDTEMIKRFEIEAQAIQHLNHPKIVEVFDHGRTLDGAPYMVMTMVDGENLSRYLKRHGKLDQAIALSLLIDIADALSYAHRSGLLHRDLKPSNVIVTNAGEIDSIGCRLVDFGIAKLMSSTQARDTQDLTKTGEVFGSPAYMSPEQCLGFKLDDRSDIYSFGCLMYEVLSGRPVVRANNPVQAVVAQLKERPESWTNTPDGKPLKGLEAIAFRCLEKDKEDRYQSVGDLLKDLKLVAAGKQPAKFERQKTEKAVLSSLQAIVLIIDGLLALMYSAMITNGLIYAVLAALSSPIFIVMFFLHLRKHGTGGSNWSRWRLLLKGTACALTLTAVFLSTVLFPIWDKATPAACWLYAGVFAVHMLLVNLALGIAGGAFFFQDSNKTNWKTIGQQALAGTGVFLFLGFVPIVFPCGSLGNSFNSSTKYMQLYESKPGLQSAMSQAAFFLGGDKQDSAELIATSCRLMGEPSKALPFLDQAIKSNPKAFNVPEMYIAKARIYLSLGKLEDALRATDHALAPDLDKYYRGDALYARGDVYRAMGKWQQALDCYNQSIEVKSSLYQATVRRARLYMRLGDWQNAIPDLSSTIDSNPSATNFLERAIAYERSGDKLNARKDYNKVVSLLGDVSLQKEPRSTYEAAIRFVFAPMIKKSIGQSLLLRAYAYQQLGEAVKSQKDLADAILAGVGTEVPIKDFQSETGIRLEFNGKK